MILYNNFDIDTYINEAREALAEMDENDASENEIYNYAASLATDDGEIIIKELEKHFNRRGRVLAVGSIGTWRGTFDGAKIYNDFQSAFYGVFRDCDYIKIEDKRGRLFIEGAHHDGTNRAEFVTLNERGAAVFDKWSFDYSDDRTEKEIHNILYSYNLFSKIPHFARDCYGVKDRKREK